MSNVLNKHESKYFNTACLMDEALLSLLNSKDFEFITVKEICAKAGVNRSTFYLHYETMDDLLQEALAYITKRFKEKFKSYVAEKELNPLTDLMLITPKYIVPYLEFLKEYRKVYMASLNNPKVFKADLYTDKALSQVILPILKQYNVPQSEQKFVLAFYVGGMHDLVFAWVKGGCKEEIDFVCSVMMKCVSMKS